MSRFRDRYGPWALVAGASEGLGAAYAAALAKRSVKPVLIARRRERLERTADKLRETHGVETRAISADLASEDGMALIEDRCRELDIGLIVCNAAAAVIGSFLREPLESHTKTLRVDCEAPLRLVHHFGRRMSRRARGGIIMLSSMSAFHGSALIANYAATKAWTLCFAEALGIELADAGIDVQACCPGATRTPNFEASRPRVKMRLAPRALSADAVALGSLRALGKRAVYIPGTGNRVAHALLHRLLPRSMAAGIMARTMYRMYGKPEE